MIVKIKSETKKFSLERKETVIAAKRRTRKRIIDMSRLLAVYPSTTLKILT